MSTIIIVIYTIVPLVSWVYVNVARALKTQILAVLVTIITWYAIVKMDFTVQVAVIRVSYQFIFKKKFDFTFYYIQFIPCMVTSFSNFLKI